MSSWVNKDLDNILKDLYKTDFFEDIKIKIQNNTLTINLKEYPFINQLIIIGEKSNRITDQLKKIMRLKYYLQKLNVQGKI